MKKLIIFLFVITCKQASFGQNHITTGDSLNQEGYLELAWMQYAQAIGKAQKREVLYKIASTAALMSTSAMRDTSFYFLNLTLQYDSTLTVLCNPDFSSLIDDPRWKKIEEKQNEKYDAKNCPAKNEEYAKELDQFLIEKGQAQLYGTQLYLEKGQWILYPIRNPGLVDFRREKIGLCSLKHYLKEKFNVHWDIPQAR